MNNSKNRGVLGKDSSIRQPQFNEPLKVRFKGCGKRLKGGKERQRGRQKRKVGVAMDVDKLINPMIRETIQCFSIGKYVFYL